MAITKSWIPARFSKRDCARLKQLAAAHEPCHDLEKQAIAMPDGLLALHKQFSAKTGLELRASNRGTRLSTL
jgi:hypothetical protein